MAKTSVTDEAIAEKKKTEERTFTFKALRAKCIKLFGCTSSTFDGAFYGKPLDKKYTIAEAKNIIEAWSRKEIGK